MNDKLVVTGYIIKSVTYLENDAIVTLLSADGLLTFKARGVKKITSKLARLINLYSYVELELTKTGKHYILTNGTVITTNSQIYNSLDSMCLLGLISESILTFLNEVDISIFILFNNLIKAINGEFDPFTMTLICLSKISLKAGYGLNVDECVKCHSKLKIVSNSFKLGGFICLNCANGEALESVEYLKTVRYVFKVDEENYFHHVISKKLSIRLIKEILEHLSYCFDYPKLVFSDMINNLY